MDALPRGRSFGNARLARKLLEGMVTRQARRLAGLELPSVSDLRTLLPEDLPEGVPTVGGRAERSRAVL